MEPNLFDDNIDIFADLTVKPKEKSKKLQPSPCLMMTQVSVYLDHATAWGLFAVSHVGPFLHFVPQ